MRLKQLVKAAHTHLYFDTSFLMWLAKAGEPTRAEFSSWQSKIGSARFHVPLWAAHEFFKHRLKKTVAKEFAADAKAFDDAASNLYEKLKLYCSDELFGFKNSGVMFLDEYTRTIQPIRGMLQLAQKSDQFEQGVQAVSSFIDDFLLSGPLDEIIANIDLDERVRNRGVIPPSFKDAHKRGGRRTDSESEDEQVAGDNSFGDLVFWREVLRHASSVNASTIVVLTADRKNDWFENQHGDKGLTEAIRRRIQKPRPVPAPHPLLKREAFDRGIGQFLLLDPMYCGVLLETEGHDYRNFASTALDTQLPRLPGKASAARSWAGRFGVAASLFGGGAAETAEGDEDEGGVLPEEIPFDPAVLELESLKPSIALPRIVGQTLNALASADTAKRALILQNLDWEKLEGWDAAAIIAFGRTLLRAADSGDPASLDFIANFRDCTPSLSEQLRECFYFGALGAAYFADDLTIRAPTNSPVALTLLDLVALSEVRHAAAAIGDGLAEARLLYKPGSGKVDLEIKVVTKPAADNKSKADLQAIKLADTNLITTLQDEKPHQFSQLLGKGDEAFDADIGSLIDVIARYHRLPRQLIKVNINTDQEVRVPQYAGVEVDI